MSKDLILLQNMSKECRNLALQEIAYYGGIPSLIYTTKLDPSTINDRYLTGIVNNPIDPNETQLLLKYFVAEVLNGLRMYDSIRRFDMFSETPTAFTIRWPLCYISNILNVLKSRTNYDLAAKIHNLIESDLLLGCATQSTTYTKRVWEVIVQIAILLRCLYAE